MTTEIVLTPEQVDALLEGVLRASGSRLGNYTYQKTLDDLHSSIRDIEQAVLQSDEVQAWKKDAERYQWLRDKSLTYSGFQADGVDGWIVMRRDSSLRRVFSYTNTDLDDAVDAAMEKQK